MILLWLKKDMQGGLQALLAAPLLSYPAYLVTYLR